jgi:RNA-directed DNA polymerase
MTGLLKRVSDKEHLLASYRRIQENYKDDVYPGYRRYASGIDGEDLKDFDLHLEKRIEDCRTFILEGRAFAPQVHRRVPKDTPGEFRDVYLLTLRDKLVQKAVADLLTPLLEKTYYPNLYSYRPSGRFGNRTAAAGVMKLLKDRDWNVHVLKTDIEDYSEHMRHDLLRRKFEELIPGEARILQLLEMFLRQPRLVKGVLSTALMGIPSGSPLTPLCNNLYLSDLDAAMFRKGCFYRRFGDDILLISPEKAELNADAETLFRILEDHGLPLSKEKTVRTGPDESFEYLGYLFEKDALRIAPKTLVKYKQWIRSELTQVRYRGERRRTPEDRRRLLKKVLKDLNTATERGLFQLPWLKTFPLLSEDGDLKMLDAFIKDRVRFCVLGRMSNRRFQTVPEAWFRELGYKSLTGAYYRVSRRRGLGPYTGWRLYFGTNFEEEADKHVPLTGLSKFWRRITDRVRFVRQALKGSAIADTPANS